MGPKGRSCTKMEMIPYVDLNTQYQNIKAEIDEAIQGAIDSTAFINGPAVHDFSNELSAYMGGCHVITCANGTDALQIALMSLGLEPGDEVILPVHAYVATTEVIALLRLTPVFVDVDPARFTIDIDQTKAAVTHRTKAIVPVHLYGQGADMEPLMTLAEEHGIKIIEDNAQAIGGAYTLNTGVTQKLGTIADMGTTSFFPAKNLGAFGDGGAVFTNTEDLAERARLVANHGQPKKYHHEIIGCNSRLDTLQAAILGVKLKYLDQYAKARQALADFYDDHLGSIENINLPFRAPNSTHVFHQYTLTTTEGRDELKQFLADQGIPSVIYYPIPLHLQKAYRSDKYPEGSFPVTERLCKSILSLPMHTEMQDEHRELIVEKVKEFFN